MTISSPVVGNYQASRVRVDGDLATITFDRFDLESYRLFLAAKALPEQQVTYDWRADTYTLTTPARFADRLGVDVPQRATTALPFGEHLFDYQRWAVAQALEARRFALWLDTGLGKTACYLEWARQVVALTGGRVLILAPLAIHRQVVAEWDRFYPGTLPPSIIATREGLKQWCASGPEPIAITNYEKLNEGIINEFRFLAGIVSDESSMLKTGGGTRKWNLIHSAKGVEYKLSCTATPAPNEAMEYASQGSFLETLRSENDILWTYFQRDKRGDWTVKPHAREAFYRFMASWSVYLRNPAVFGFGDILATLPEPEIIEERIEMTPAQHARLSEMLVLRGAGLWADDRLGTPDRLRLMQIARGFLYHGGASEAQRRIERIPANKPSRVAEWVRGEIEAGRPTLVWTTFDAEATVLVGELGPFLCGARIGILTGDMSEAARVEVLDAFRAGEVPLLISKPTLIGFGLNLQFVQSMVFSGFDDSFERMYQAVRRAYRFGQTERVRVFVPYVPELEGMVFDNLRRKEQRFMAEVAQQEEHYREVLGMVAA